jgi:hypothetical protein
MSAPGIDATVALSIVAAVGDPWPWLRSRRRSWRRGLRRPPRWPGRRGPEGMTYQGASDGSPTRAHDETVPGSCPVPPGHTGAFVGGALKLFVLRRR